MRSGSDYYIRGKNGNADAVLLDPSSNGNEFFTYGNGDLLGETAWNTSTQEFDHYYYVKDHLGNIRVILDQNGGSDVMNDYYPFGESMRSQVNSGPDDRYGFTSKELDGETGLYHMGARSYDPWSGRFEETDPLAVLSPEESPYAYSFDNPIAYSDPFGLDTMYTQMPNKNGGYSWVSNWIPDNIVTPQNQGQQSGSLVTLQEMLDQEQAYVDRIQRQADRQAKAETKAFYHGSFNGTANIADKVSESQNYSMAGEVLFGQEEALPVSFTIGRIADFVSLSAKGLDVLTGGSRQAFIDQLGKTGVSLATLNILKTSEAGAQIADDPVFKTALKLTISQVMPK